MYFIEYTKHELIICCDDSDDMSCYINLVINKYDGMYVFFQFANPKKYMYYGIKQIIKLKNNEFITS